MDTLAPSYNSLATHETRAVAARAESLKDEKYSDLLHTQEFSPDALDFSGVLGPRLLLFVKELGRKLSHQTGRRRQGVCLSHPTIVCCRAAEQCNFNIGEYITL